MNPSSTARARFVVGVDFGTTFTSVAFAYSGSPEEVKLVDTWQNSGSSNPDSDQVPTELHYINPATRENVWGYGIPKNTRNSVEPLKWFKLLLQNSGISKSTIRTEGSPFFRAQRSSSVSSTDSLSSVLDDLALSADPASVFTPPTTTPAYRTEEKLQQMGIEPVTVVADFLSHVRDITVDSIERTYGDWIRTAEIEWVLTVPAIWTDAAKDLMVQAATKAKFGKHRRNFNLVSEPEAAAAYTLKAIQPNHLNIGDTFIICDAGGGTVDLISYKIEGLNPLRISEAATGSGELCGSVFVDQRFDQYMRRRIGDREINKMMPRAKNEMMSSWERDVKFKFGNMASSMEGFEVNVLGLPDSKEMAIQECYHSIETGDVQAMFDPIVNYIVKLVKEQYGAVEKQGKTVAAILLVGGFGSSEYLLQQLKAAQYGESSISLQVLQPMNARNAIARGALIRGLDGSIVRERFCRYHYGCSSTARYKAGTEHDNHRIWSRAYDEWQTTDHMTWFVQRNSAIGSDTSATYWFLRAVPICPGTKPQLVFETVLYVCDEDQAPDFKWRKPGAVRKLCTLRSDLSGVETKRFHKFKNSKGQEFYEVSFSLRMSVVDEVLNLERLFEGKSYGSVSTDFK